MNPRSVMHVIDSLAVGGAERVLVDLANNTDPGFYRVSACITRRDSTLASELRPGIPLHILDRRFSLDPRGFTRLAACARQQSVDLFHAHGRSTFQFLLTARSLGLISQPIVLHDHFGSIDIDPSVPWWFRVWGAKKVDYYVGVCDRLGTWALQAGVAQRLIAVVGNAFDLNRIGRTSARNIRQELNISLNHKVCVMVGNIRPEKGLDLLVASCQGLPVNELPIFVEVGRVIDPDYMSHCQQQIERAGLREHFRFTGKQDDALGWIKGADFAALPSRSESGPLVLLEYMACSVPFVSFNVGGISRDLAPHLPEYFADPGDTAGFGKILQQLNQMDSAAREIKGRAAHQQLRDRFDVCQVMERWYSVYRAVLGQGT